MHLAPTSTITGPKFASAKFTLTWSGTDDTGLRHAISTSLCPTMARLLLPGRLTQTSALFTGVLGHVQLLSVATDNVGNTQPTP